MASIVLSAVGSAAGASTGLPFAATIGLQLGRGIGQSIDSVLFPSAGGRRHHEGPRLADLAVQTSTYGKVIPIIYGTVRIAGNIIWSQPIKETAITTTSSSGSAGGKGGGGKVTQSSTSYVYSVTLAIAICEGPVDDVLRVWADAKQLNLSQYTMRIYKGDETQLPDSLIQAIEGVDNTPAYRGLAYVVFEDFPLFDYGNRIPNFTFEVRKKSLYADYNGETLENMITGMVMIPGAGEYVYDTHIQYKILGMQVGANWVQRASREQINMHNNYGKANSLLALDQLKATCPNVEWISVVVSWFGTDMNAGNCAVLPGVEYQNGAITYPDSWQVAGFTRSTAHQIMMVNNAPQYGGTPDDNSMLRYLDELKARGYKIAFYPMMFMDVSGKPWRGDLTGSTVDVAGFFTKANGYNAFITHYANLVKTKVDAFVIGSELKGLTRVTDTPGSYPAVTQLVGLAAQVKAVVGINVKVTYAADWSEYHHTDGGWYNLDPLWASADIDVIGIDAYFPLSDAPQVSYNIDALVQGWTSGEGYDWYYNDPQRTVKVNLSPEYAWKNLTWFWNNTHVNPDSSSTAWIPQSKPIWFIEYGFPSVDGATNQPNVFYDPNSISGALPYYSRGRTDFLAQRAGLIATQVQWKNSAMVEQMFVWTWDARPYPYWPDLTRVWSDGYAWKTGHWVQGKLGISSLAAIVSDLCQRAGFLAADIDVSDITHQVEGYIINTQQTVRDAIETLQTAFFFDSVESDGICKFVAAGGEVVAQIPENDLLPVEDTHFAISRAQEIELPKQVNIIYLSRLANYHSLTQHSQREATASSEVRTISLPIVISDQIAKNIADIMLFSLWTGRISFRFYLPVAYAFLEPTDVIEVTVSGITHRMRITSTMVSTPSALEVSAVMDDPAVFDFHGTVATPSTTAAEEKLLAQTQLEFLDIPALPGDEHEQGLVRYAARGLSDNWPGCALYRSDDGGANYNRVADINAAATIGTTLNSLGVASPSVFDVVNRLTVLLMGEQELQSVTDQAVLNGANAALVGNEIIQFTTATFLEPGTYELSNLLRGRLGTEWAITPHAAGERFVLLDGSISRQAMPGSLIGLPRTYKCVTLGSSLADAEQLSFAYTGIALKPYSPVHIRAIRNEDNDLIVSWVRRARFGGSWLDYADVPLHEFSEQYEIDILNGSTVVRTIKNIYSGSAIYSAADQVSDFGSVQASVALNIYQLSGITGRGYPGTATV